MQRELYRQVSCQMDRSMKNISYLPRWGVLLLDLLLCSFAFWVSVWVGSGFLHYIDISLQPVHIGMQYLIVMTVQLLTFWAYSTYSGILRYSTFIDTIKVLLANATVGLVLVLFNWIMDYTTGQHPILNTVLAIYVPVSFLLLFILVAALTAWGIKQGRSLWGLDLLLFFVAGVAGCIIAFMVLFSEHPAVSPNYLLLLLHPLHLIFLYHIVKRVKKLQRSVYLGANMVVILLFLAFWALIPQKFPIEIVPLALILLVRCISNIVLSYRKA